jgi:hypothetical protein
VGTTVANKGNSPVVLADEPEYFLVVVGKRISNEPHRGAIALTTGALETGYFDVVEEVGGDQVVDEIELPT